MSPSTSVSDLMDEADRTLAAVAALEPERRGSLPNRAIIAGWAYVARSTAELLRAPLGDASPRTAGTVGVDGEALLLAQGVVDRLGPRPPTATPHPLMLRMAQLIGASGDLVRSSAADADGYGRVQESAPAVWLRAAATLRDASTLAGIAGQRMNYPSHHLAGLAIETAADADRLAARLDGRAADRGATAQVAALGDLRTRPSSAHTPAEQLERAVGEWRGRALSAMEDPYASSATMRSIATTARTLTGTGMVLAAASTEVGQGGDAVRAVPALRAATSAWGAAASSWGTMVAPGPVADGLAGASLAVQVAAHGLTRDESGWASPESIAARAPIADSLAAARSGLTAAQDLSGPLRESTYVLAVSRGVYVPAGQVPAERDLATRLPARAGRGSVFVEAMPDEAMHITETHRSLPPAARAARVSLSSATRPAAASEVGAPQAVEQASRHRNARRDRPEAHRHVGPQA